MSSIELVQQDGMNFRYASLATGSSAYLGEIEDSDGTPIINLQLDSWLKAKEEFSRLQQSPWNPGTGRHVVFLLGDSLATLFGMNQRTQAQRTPYLRSYIDSIFPAKRYLDLRKDDPALYGRFIQLDDDYKNVSKHMDSGKTDLVTALDRVRVGAHLETTRLIWLWFLHHIFDGAPPGEQTQFFDPASGYTTESEAAAKGNVPELGI